MQRDHNQGGQQVSTATQAGEQKVLASYETDEGERQLVAQRVQGTVALSDIPTTDHGRVHLVERQLSSLAELEARQLSSLAELEALVADYLQTARRTGRCPMQGWL